MCMASFTANGSWKKLPILSNTAAINIWVMADWLVYSKHLKIFFSWNLDLNTETLSDSIYLHFN